MKRCPACLREYRKGALAIVVAHGPPFTRKRVCFSCAERALAIVAVATREGEPKRERGPSPADFRGLLRQLATLARASQRIADDPGKADDVRAWARGRAEGFEGATVAVKAALP